MARHIRLLARMEANLDGAGSSNSSPASRELGDAEANDRHTYEQDHTGHTAASEDVDASKENVATASDETADAITLKPCMVCMDAPASSTFVHGKTGHTVCCLPCA